VVVVVVVVVVLLLGLLRCGSVLSARCSSTRDPSLDGSN
jgi:hypothetical protein